MRFRVFLAVLAVASASAAAACSLFAGLDGFTDGTDASPDAAPDASTAVPNEGGADGNAGGDSSSSDASVDGARFCANKDVAVCEDFDDADPLVDWPKTIEPGASFDLVTDRAFSAPRAARAGITASNSDRGGYITRNLAGAGVISHARLSYALYVEQRPAAGEIELNILRFNCGSMCTSDFYIAVGSTGANLVEQFLAPDGGSESNYRDLGSSIPTGKWLRIELEVVLSGTRKMRLKVDGTLVMDQQTFLVGPGVANVHAGITYASSEAKVASVVVDDLLFEVLP